MSACFACGKELTIDGRVGRADECPACHADLHCCRNCRFYDRSAYNECREPSAERVVEKEKANFCDYFELAAGAVGVKETDKVAEARRKLERLFKKP